MAKNGVAPGRTLVVGLDSCDHVTAEALTASGAMPVLGRLLLSAARCPLRLPPRLFVNALWPSFATGLGADRHTFHCWDEIEVASYRRRLTTPRDMIGTPFWRRLGAAGYPTVSIDVPHTVVAHADNCIEIAEWGAHDRHLGLQVSPAAEAATFDRDFGLHPIFGMRLREERSFAPDDHMHRAGQHRTAEEEKQLTEGLIAGIEIKRQLSHELLHGRPWDLFITVFGEGHAVGHQQWHLHDPAHPRFEASVQESIGGDPIVRVYAGLDAALGRLLATVDDRTTVLVILSHGMGPHHDGTHLLEEVLRRIDLADRLAAGESLSAASQRRLGDLKLLLRNTARRLKGAPRREFASALERARQRFFLAPNNYVYGGVRLNKAGREPKGCVRPTEVESVIAGLERDLTALVNVATGDPAILGVERAENWFRRTNDDTIPDLFLDWERSGPIETVWSAKTGRIHAPYVNWRTGDHRDRGLLLATGPGIAAGASHGEIAIEDLPASLTARFGLAHADMDGKPVDWLMG